MFYSVSNIFSLQGYIRCMNFFMKFGEKCGILKWPLQRNIHIYTQKIKSEKDLFIKVSVVAVVEFLSVAVEIQ